MWVFCKSGFFSVVQNKDDPDLLHIRSQFRGDLERLCKRLADDEHDAIIETPTGDYRFRMNVSYRAWEFFLKRESDDIDYVRAKPAMHDPENDLRNEAYLDVFMKMMFAGREEAFNETKNERKAS